MSGPKMKSITITVVSCAIGACNEPGESSLPPYFCQKHAQEFYESPEGREAYEVREKKEADFTARLNGSKVRCCTQCDRWGTSEDISMRGDEGGEEPFCDDREACDRRWRMNKWRAEVRAKAEASHG